VKKTEFQEAQRGESLLLSALKSKAVATELEVRSPAGSTPEVKTQQPSSVSTFEPSSAVDVAKLQVKIDQLSSTVDVATLERQQTAALQQS
jgi:hypothetical protein